MKLYRYGGEVGGYLHFEVIGISRQDVIDRFSRAVRAKCKKSGGDWAEEAIEYIANHPDQIDELAPGAVIDEVPYS